MTDIGIFHSGILGLKYPSQVYLEAHLNSFFSLRMSEDPVVKEALDCQIQRKGSGKKKSSTVMECQDVFEKLSTTYLLELKITVPNLMFPRGWN